LAKKKQLSRIFDGSFLIE